MRIAILTLHLHTNYGGILQAYALQTILKNLGYDSVILDKPKFKLPIWKMPFAYLKRILKKTLTNNPNCSILIERAYQKQYEIESQHIQKFINKYLNIQYLNSLSSSKAKKYDIYIVGSDQVWRPEYFKMGFGNIKNAYLDFLGNKNVKRIAYAASFGVSEWTYTKKETNKCRSLLNKFYAISIREDSGIVLCKQHLHKEAEHTLDPTLLLDKKDYIKLITNRQTQKGNLLVYFLNNTKEKTQFVHFITQKKQYTPFYTHFPTGYQELPIEKRIQPPVESWLQGFDDAEFVITDSFHACVFSILFNKPFYVIGNESRGLTRITSLLKQFGLEDRLIKDTSPIPFPNDKIDWEDVNNRLANLRKKSYDFLTKSLA